MISPNLTGTISLGTNSRDRMMQEEFGSLYSAIAIAVFLVFVVMASQFESVKFSVMVMTTIPFSLVGSFGFLKITGVTISMTTLLGFLILIGTVVNNGILYVDTVNQYRQEMDLHTALVEAGATRIRPILMTSLTTILSMIDGPGNRKQRFNNPGYSDCRYWRPGGRRYRGPVYAAGLLRIVEP